MTINRPRTRLQARAMVNRRSVVAVLVYKEKTCLRSGRAINSGSGSVIKRTAQGSIVLTSDHTLGDVPLVAEDVVVVRWKKRGVGVLDEQAIVRYRNSDMDVAILEVHGLRSLPPLKFVEGDSRIGKEIIAVGYCDPKQFFKEKGWTAIPACSPGRVRPQGTVCQGTFDGLLLSHVYLKCVGLKGMSGGPVISRRGVIGMLDSGVEGRIVVAVSTASIRQVIARYLGQPVNANTTLRELIRQIA